MSAPLPSDPASPGEQAPKEYAYPAAVWPVGHRAPAWEVEVPDLPDCESKGDTLPEALANAVDAVQAWITQALDRGEALPPASALDDLARQTEYADALWVLIVRRDKPSDLEISKALAEADVLPALAALPLEPTVLEPLASEPESPSPAAPNTVPPSQR
jgi:predicted RNase H-like HicB family nuclease